MFELKYFNDAKLGDYKSYFGNLVLNHIVPTEPAEPKKEKVGNIELTVWDNFEYKINSTLVNLLIIGMKNSILLLLWF